MILAISKCFLTMFVINLANPCAIDSIMQENHKELKIFLPKCIISRLIKIYISERDYFDL